MVSVNRNSGIPGDKTRYGSAGSSGATRSSGSAGSAGSAGSNGSNGNNPPTNYKSEITFNLGAKADYAVVTIPFSGVVDGNYGIYEGEDCGYKVKAWVNSAGRVVKSEYKAPQGDTENPGTPENPISFDEALKKPAGTSGYYRGTDGKLYSYYNNGNGLGSIPCDENGNALPTKPLRGTVIK